MAAIVIDDGFNFKTFVDHLASRLPVYAHPLFLRVSPAVDTTETFKQKKQQLIREGFDPALVAEPLYFRDLGSGEYRSLDAARFADIAAGKIRL
jgi:fatty-acyl-CoA synthase